MKSKVKSRILVDDVLFCQASFECTFHFLSGGLCKLSQELYNLVVLETNINISNLKMPNNFLIALTLKD